MKVTKHAELIAERIVFGRSSTPISHFFLNQCNISPIKGFTGCVPEEACDGQDIALIEEVTFWCACTSKDNPCTHVTTPTQAATYVLSMYANEL